MVGKVNISNCPFCGGNAAVDNISHDVGEGSYMRTLEYVRVKCGVCEATSKDLRKKPFCDITECTVQDFRDNPHLRDVETVKYTEYCYEMEALAIAEWNKRYKEVT
jgi:hypothetical protein